MNGIVVRADEVQPVGREGRRGRIAVACGQDLRHPTEPNSILISAISCVVFDCCNSTESWNFTNIPIKMSNFVSERLVAGAPADLTEDSIGLSLE